jgi:chemotaxis signal transduction protein
MVAPGSALFGGSDVAATKALVFGGARMFGLTVDAVIGSAMVPGQDIIDVPPAFGSCGRLLLEAFAWLDGQLVGVLAPDEVAAELFEEILPDESDASDAPASVMRETFRVTDCERILDVELNAGAAALPAVWVRHISDYRAPATLARAGNGILGALSWRRRPVPLIPMSGSGASGTLSGGSIVVVGPAWDQSRGDAALLVERVAGVQRGAVPTDEGVLLRDGRRLPLVDVAECIVQAWTE